MKGKIIIAVVLVLGVFGLMAFAIGNGGKNTPPPKPEIDLVEGGPLISWKTDLIDLGKIPHKVNQTFTFDFTNVGDHEVVIETVKKSCGCTEPKWIKTAVKPGEKGWVGATFTAPSLGMVSKTVTVMSNDKDAPTKVLYFKAEVVDGTNLYEDQTMGEVEE